MQCIDGCVFPFPSGLQSVTRIVTELRNLGFSGAVICNSPGPQKRDPSFTLYHASYIAAPILRDVQKEIRTAEKESRLCLVRAGDEGFNRGVLSSPGVHVLCDLHLSPKNSFDRVCAQYAADRNVAIDIRISPLCELRGVARQRVIRQYEEILLLEGRYEFPLTISSGARSPVQMRSTRAMKALLEQIGMNPDLIDRSFSSVISFSEKYTPVRRVPG